MNNSITAVIFAKNEGKKIVDSIKNAAILTDQIILVDMGSTDDTATIARKNKVTVYSFPNSKYVELARYFGIKKSSTDWVFIVDADERITDELSKEIKSSIHHSPATYYKVPRKNIFGRKKWLSHGGWWPDFQTRLINKRCFIDWPKRIHSTPAIKGECGYLKSPLEHYFHGDIKNMVDKTIIFEDIESDLLYKAGRDVSTVTFFRKYFAELFRRLVLKVGFMDGTIGIIELMYQAFSKTITYLMLYEKKL